MCAIQICEKIYKIFKYIWRSKSTKTDLSGALQNKTLYHSEK